MPPYCQKDKRQFCLAGTVSTLGPLYSGLASLPFLRHLSLNLTARTTLATLSADYTLDSHGTASALPRLCMLFKWPEMHVCLFCQQLLIPFQVLVPVPCPLCFLPSSHLVRTSAVCLHPLDCTYFILHGSTSTA